MNENEVNVQVEEQNIADAPVAENFTAEAQVDAEGNAVTETVEIAENQAENSEANLDENIENDFSKNENNIEGENESEDIEMISKEEYTLLEEKYNNLQNDYDALKSERDSLFEFKSQIEDKEKLDLIQKEFSMLSEEETKDVLENRQKYSLNEIKSQLAVIYFDKCSKETAVEAANAEQKNTEVPTTFSLDSMGTSTISDPIAAELMRRRKSM